MNERISALLGDLKAGLARLYGTRLREVLLYGSYARGEEDDESDVDVLIVLDKVERYGDEVDRTSVLNSELSLKYGVAISRTFVPERDWTIHGSSFLANVREEAIPA